jgi:hypothetical protein
MTDPTDTKLLVEIRDLLAEQNRLIADIKVQNADHVGRAEALAAKQMAQNETALSEARATNSKVGRTTWIIAAVVVAVILFFSWRS